MNVTITIGTMPCDVRSLKINDVEASYHDFIELQDHDKTNAPQYGCGDMKATPIQSTPEVLKRYNITQEEYDEITKKLCAKLKIGYCSKC
jgi:predicted metal-binding transcription factor (methanogenesis marker protein 9)